MLTLTELRQRYERDTELFERLTAERETVRIRRYRYAKAITNLEDLEQAELEFDHDALEERDRDD